MSPPPRAGRLTRRARILVFGAVLSAVGAAVAIIFFFQSWRSCEGEDTSAGCPMLAGDAAVLQISVIVLLVGIVVLAAGVLTPRSGLPRRRRA
ncbi:MULTISPECIES: hypothetical protein [Microbacterium]|uniref:hypothetical protein n=1 Tax=Microbacterium TaxID=33882 RepID=UPI00277F4600|nr:MULTISPECIES: hypothetical protein [Microbacterium]MDQ1083142.1 cell division protein FtsX [Microbacterium sp. SORGH_AS_0344]MDQ1171586.1 cell division protein FtsX [Microbacterium proteolyticum]